jgi:benzoyl-CoA reductase/2-hydroxyglutaryl-CoA dehydratase subunit BcrC/BadD/HgdB
MSVKAQLDKFREVIAGPTNQHIQDWKSSGRGVIGYFCSYVPVELIQAAGLLPVRLRGAGSTDSGPADAYLSARICTYVRHTLTLALQGQYDYLDGEIGLNTCDHVRRAFDLWRHKTKVPFHGFISVPRSVRDSLFPYFKEEIENLKSALEKNLAAGRGDSEAFGGERPAGDHRIVRDAGGRLHQGSRPVAERGRDRRGEAPGAAAACGQ